MNSLLLANASEIWLSAAIVIVAILTAIAGISALIMRIVLLLKYNNFNSLQASSGHTAYSAARNLLDENGMSDIKVKPLGFFKSIFYGNCYSAKQKTIYLRKSIINQSSITAVGIACQKVGLVMQDKENNTAFKIRAIVSPFIIFAPAMIIPILVFGIILDTLFTLGGTLAIVSVCIGIFLYVLAFIYTLLTIPVESRANKLALELIEKSNLLNATETLAIKQIFTSYLLVYVLEFVATLLQSIKVFLQLLLICTK